MQVHIVISFHGCKRKFFENIHPYLTSFPNVTTNEFEGTNWNVVGYLIPVESQEQALTIRHRAERLCKETKKGLKPTSFRFRKADVQSASQLSLYGLTADETKRFNEKAPPSVYRTINV